jgi:5-methylcytosine-specific restriction protein A
MVKGSHTKEAKEKMSENYKYHTNSGTFVKGHEHSETTIKKIIDGMRGKVSPRKGVHLSDETKELISLNRTGKGIGIVGKWNLGRKPWNYIDGRSKTMGPERYGDDWDKIRYLIYLRDKFTCQDCGIKGIRLDVHHKIPFLISFDNSLENLISLCRSCHRKREVQIMRDLKNQEIIQCPLL